MRVLKADITTEAGRQAIAEATRPELHLLVHSAGAFLRAPIADMGLEAWAALDSVNLHAPILLTAACLPQLRAGAGQVAMINSTAALQSRQGIAAYAASKRALQTATDILRNEINPHGIRVVSIFPGRTRTDMQDRILAEEGRTAGPDTLLEPDDVAFMLLAALKLPRNAEVTDIMMRPMRPL
jgi:NAD(P)-dependent dehydrogenase (short-subunit alcohol dehydrogenase family)